MFGIPQLTALCIPIKYLYFSLYDVLKIIFIHITYDSRIKIYLRVEINQFNKIISKFMLHLGASFKSETKII